MRRLSSGRGRMRGAALGEVGCAGIPRGGARIPTVQCSPPCIYPHAGKRQAKLQREVFVCDKARLDAVAHSKKSLVQRRPALRGRSSCCPEAWTVA